MPPENQHFDRKSLRKVTGRTAAWSELALDCVAFANAQGGSLLIGIEDDQEAPPPGQAIPPGLAEAVVKRARELTVNVELAASVTTAANGGEFIALRVARAHGVASTTDGRYALRIGNESKPVVGDDVARLLTDRPARPWESLPVTGLTRDGLDADKCIAFVAAVRASSRVKDSVKDKSTGELLDHYDLAAAGTATHLGVLLLGKRQDRARLGTAPVVQCLKFDEQGLMEREGSGFDRMYDRLLASGRPPPVPTEGLDSVTVTVTRRIVKPQVIALIDEADRRFQLSQRERITLGILAQADGLTAIELCRQVEVAGADALELWLGRLLVLGLVQTSGRTKGQRYFVAPELLCGAKVPRVTTLARIEPHRLRALILEDLARYPESASPEIKGRIGAELSVKTIKRALDELVASGQVAAQGERRWRRYWLADKGQAAPQSPGHEP